MADILTKLKTLLEDNWKPSNTENRVPQVTSIFEVKRVSLNSDYIFLKELNRRPEDNSSGAQAKRTETAVVIDIRTMNSRVQLTKLRDEVERILNNNQVDPFGDSSYDIQDITNITDFSDRTVKLWRMTVDVRFEQFNETIS